MTWPTYKPTWGLENPLHYPVPNPKYYQISIINSQDLRQLSIAFIPSAGKWKEPFESFHCEFQTFKDRSERAKKTWKIFKISIRGKENERKEIEMKFNNLHFWSDFAFFFNNVCIYSHRQWINKYTLYSPKIKSK